jgi:hypothetical protein
LPLYEYGTTPLKIKPGGQAVEVVKFASGTCFFGVSAGGGVALPDPIAAGDTEIYVDAVPVIAVQGTTYTVFKSVTASIACTLRFTFSVYCGGTGAYGRLNGSVQGVIPSSEIFVSNYYTTKTMDITFAAGETVYVEIKSNGGTQTIGTTLILLGATAPDVQALFDEVI